MASSARQAQGMERNLDPWGPWPQPSLQGFTDCLWGPEEETRTGRQRTAPSLPLSAVLKPPRSQDQGQGGGRWGNLQGRARPGVHLVSAASRPAQACHSQHVHVQGTALGPGQPHLCETLGSTWFCVLASRTQPTSQHSWSSLTLTPCLSCKLPCLVSSRRPQTCTPSSGLPHAPYTI